MVPGTGHGTPRLAGVEGVSGLPGGFSTPIPLGEGGQAKVFLVWQEVPGRWVVLKVAHRAMGESLRREGELLSRLGGGAAPALLDQDLSVPEPWLAMTWVEGVPLDYLPESLPMSDRRALCLQAGLAVARLHGARTIHGDLSAGNLIAKPHGEVAVVDFGLSPTQGSAPSVEGTWEVLPPERFEGGAPDPRWDVFALGVLSLRLIRALPPGEHTRDSWRELCASGELSRWARGRSWALSLALSADPAQRPADAAEWVRLLEKEWGDPPFSKNVLSACVADHIDKLLASGVELARRRRDGASGWRLQRERIERSENPEPLLAGLAELRGMERKSKRAWWIAAASIAVIAGSVGGWLWARPADRPDELVGEDSKPSWLAEYPQAESPIADVLVFDPPPAGAKLVVDGNRRPVPGDGFLRLPSGSHHVQLSDSMGRILCDTHWNVPRAPKPSHTAKPPSKGEGRKHP